MIHPALAPLVRRAILDLILDVGGEVDDDAATTRHGPTGPALENVKLDHPARPTGRKNN